MSEILTRNAFCNITTNTILREHDEALRKRVEELEKANNDVWTELVRRGWASEIGASKFRSLVAETKLVRLVDQLPGTYVTCGRHFFAVVRGDEECPICQLQAERDAALAAKQAAGEQVRMLREALAELPNGYRCCDGRPHSR